MTGIIKLTCFLILIIYGISYTQTTDTTFSDQLIEDILPEPNTDYQEYYEIDELEILRNNPVNINTADIVTLQKVPGLDLNYALIILRFRKKYGYYFSPNELYSIKEIPKELIKNILPFITTSNVHNAIKGVLSKDPSSLIVNFKSRSSYNLHEINDTLFEKYPGSKLKLYNRLAIMNNKTEFGLITEKDPGEESYFDFWTSHLIIKNIGPFDDIILGDFRFESGFGLILGAPYGFSKTTDAVYPIKKKERLIQPNNSSNENSYYRGAAASIEYNNFIFSGFYSNRFRDATLDSNSKYISSLLSSGYHRTNNEINNNNLAHELKWGIRSEYNYNSLFSTSLLFCSTHFNKPFFNNSPYSPQGDNFNDLSCSYDFHTDSTIYMTGEFAYDFNSVASLNALQIAFNKDFLFFSSIRNYPRNFISLSGHSLAVQNGKIQNEIGFYNGFKLETVFGKINVYYDQFRFPFGSYRFPVSNYGEEFLLEYSNIFPDNTNIKLDYKYEDKDYLLNDTVQIYIGRRLRNDLRFTIRWDLSREIGIKSVIEYNSIRIRQGQLNEQGILLSSSLDISPIDQVKLAFSVSFFRTDSFYSSVYEYDANINGLVTGRILYGEGLKLNIYFNYHLFHNLDISAQYSETFKPKETLINTTYSILTNSLFIQVETVFN